MKQVMELKQPTYYNENNKTLYIHPPLKVKHLYEIRKLLRHSIKLDVKNIVIGVPNESNLSY